MFVDLICFEPMENRWFVMLMDLVWSKVRQNTTMIVARFWATWYWELWVRNSIFLGICHFNWMIHPLFLQLLVKWWNLGNKIHVYTLSSTQHVFTIFFKSSKLIKKAFFDQYLRNSYSFSTEKIVEKFCWFLFGKIAKIWRELDNELLTSIFLNISQIWLFIEKKK